MKHRKLGRLQARVLGFLDYEPKSVDDIAVHFGMVRAPISKCIASLERRGYAVRSRGSRYALQAAVTEDGLDALVRMRTAAAKPQPAAKPKKAKPKFPFVFISD